MADTVTLVVSGRTFPQVPKEKLIISSSYFRSRLKGDFKDSNEAVYEFPNWSSTAFDFLLHYMVTGGITLAGQCLDTVREALALSDYLIVDKFKSELTRILVGSWTTLELDFALQLANELDYYVLHCFLDLIEKKVKVSYNEIIYFTHKFDSKLTSGQKLLEKDKIKWTSSKPHAEKHSQISILNWYQDVVKDKKPTNYHGKVPFKLMRMDKRRKHRNIWGTSDYGEPSDIDYLNVSAQFENSILLWFLDVIETDGQDSSHIEVNLDFLISITGMKTFWSYDPDLEMSTSPEIFSRNLIVRCLYVLGLAITLPSSSEKAQILVRNLCLHNFTEMQLQSMWQMLKLEKPSSKCVQSAFKGQREVIRKRMQGILAHVRTAGVYSQPEFQTCTLLSNEFDSRTWIWKHQNISEKLREFTLCVASDKYSVFFDELGVHFIPGEIKDYRKVPCERIGDFISQNIVSCSGCYAEGNNIFILSHVPSSAETKIFKFDITKEELTECVSIPVKMTKLAGQKDTLYIVSDSLDVYEYDVQSNNASVVPIAKNDFSQFDNILVIDKVIYLFAKEEYAAIDTAESEDERFITKRYVGPITRIWSFRVLATAPSREGIVMLLHLDQSTYKPADGVKMIALLNPSSGEMECLGALPMTREKMNIPWQSSFVCLQKDQRPM